MANIISVLSSFGKFVGSKARNTMGASEGVAGPDKEANSGLRDPKPYRTYTNNGIFEGYDGSVWLYHKLPEDVQVDWTKTPRESADNQAYMIELLDKMGQSIAIKESTRKDTRIKFHISLAEETSTTVSGYDGMSAAHADYIKRMGGFPHQIWHGYIGFQLRQGSIQHGVYGWREQFRNYIDLVGSTDNTELKVKLLSEDMDRIRALAAEHRLRELDFVNNPLDFELLTAWYGEADDVYAKPREMASSRLKLPEHGDSIITPQWGEIMFHAMKPLDNDDTFMSDPYSESQVRFGNAILAPSANTVHVNIRGEIRSPHTAENLFEDKMNNAMNKQERIRREQSEGKGLSYSTKKDADDRVSNAQYALEMASIGHSMLDNVEIVVANKVTGKKQMLNEYLRPYGLQIVPITARQHVALCSTVPTYPDTVFRVPSSNIKRNPNTLNMYGGVIGLSGLFRSTRPCGPGGILIGLSDAGYEFKEIYTELDAAYKYSGQPVILVTGTTGSGKAMPLDQAIRKADGSTTTFGEVRVGDVLIGMDGKPTNVVSVTEVMNDHDVFEMFIKDGRRNRSDAEHQWLVADNKAIEKWRNNVSRPYHKEVSVLVDEAKRKLKSCCTNDKNINIEDIPDFIRGIVPEVYDLLVTSPYFWDMVPTCSNVMTERKAALCFIRRMEEVTYSVNDAIREFSLGVREYPLMMRRTTKEIQYMIEKGESLYIPGNKAVEGDKALGDLKEMSWENYSARRNIPEWVYNSPVMSRRIIYTNMIHYPEVKITKVNNNKIHAYIEEESTLNDLMKISHSLGIGFHRSSMNNVVMYPNWDMTTKYNSVNKLNYMSNNDLHMYQIEKVNQIESTPVRCLSVDNPSKTFLLDDWTVTSNTQQMLQMNAQVSYMGHPVFFLNPKPGKSSLKDFFDMLGGITINMSHKYLEENPGLLDPMFFLRDKKDVGKLLADMIINSMKMTDTEDKMNSMKIITKMQAQLIERAELPHNLCSYDIIFGNGRAGTPRLEQDEIVDFVREKMEVSAFWKASISKNAEANEELRRLIFSGKPVLIEWGDSLQMPSSNDPDKWSPEQMDAVQSVTNLFSYASEVIGSDRRGGMLTVDEAHVLLSSEEAMNIVRKSGKVWRQANIRLMLATQELKEFLGDNENNISASIGAHIIMQVETQDEEELKIFYKITGLPESARYTEYIGTAGVDQNRGKFIPNGVYVDKIYNYMSGFLAGPWPKRELSAGLTDKEGEEARRNALRAAADGSIFNDSFGGGAEIEQVKAAYEVMSESEQSSDI